MHRASRITIWVRYGSKNGYGSLRGDPDVWNEELSSRVLSRTSSKSGCNYWGMDHGYGLWVMDRGHSMDHIHSYPLKWYGSWVWMVRGMDRAFTCWSAAICHISLLSHRSATGLLSSSTVLQYTGAICQKIYGSLTISRITHGPETKCNVHQFSLIFLKYFMKKSGDKGIATKTENSKLDSRSWGEPRDLSTDAKKGLRWYTRETKGQPFERNPKDDTQTKTQLGRLQAIQRKTNAERHQTKSQRSEWFLLNN